MIAYHFLRADFTAQAGSEPAWTVGEERTFPRVPVLCVYGYHSSASWLDALTYAPGPIACVVEISDPVERASDKQVSKKRKLLAAWDVSRELRLFACDCAERALTQEREAGREPDPRSWAAIEVARRYAAGEATVPQLTAAGAAAWAAAGDAA
ncbi:MAG TPA: hypothetical protein VFU47_03900, partial [Armatimonadota bacterium]|nr:hypothetical protein [Armatimonadota bacterium]